MAVTLKSSDKWSSLIRRWWGIDSVSPPGREWRDKGDWDEKRDLNMLMHRDCGGGLWEDRRGKTGQLDRVKTRVIDEAEERQRRIKGREEYKRERLNQSEWMKERQNEPRTHCHCVLGRKLSFPWMFLTLISWEHKWSYGHSLPAQQPAWAHQQSDMLCMVAENITPTDSVYLKQFSRNCPGLQLCGRKMMTAERKWK